MEVATATATPLVNGIAMLVMVGPVRARARSRAFVCWFLGVCLFVRVCVAQGQGDSEYCQEIYVGEEVQIQGWGHNTGVLDLPEGELHRHEERRVRQEDAVHRHNRCSTPAGSQCRRPPFRPAAEIAQHLI